MGKRRRAREMAVQMLYQRDLGGSSLERIFATFDPAGYADPEPDEPAPGSDRDQEPGEARVADRVASEAFADARRLVEGTVEKSAEVDDLIRDHAENWRLERMPAIDRNILRLAVYEMISNRGVPKVVVVDEAIELAKKFGSEDSGRFVNGLLDAVLHASPADRPRTDDRTAAPAGGSA